MSKYRQLSLKIAGALLLLGIVAAITIQFVPVERSNPPVVSEPPWNSPQTRALAERACFDCHSNETKWPWYARIAPVSWLVSHDVAEGRAALNFSEWGLTGDARGETEEDERVEHRSGRGGERAELDEIAEEVQRGKMPLPYYLWLHPEARLTPAETQALIAGLKATFGSEAAGAMVK